MSYIKRTMQTGEEVKLPVKLHWINYFSVSCLGFLMILLWGNYFIADGFLESDLWLVLLIATGAVVYKFFKLWFTEMAVTNKRVVLRKGIIAIDSDEIKNGKIEGIEVEQSVLGRILNYGNVCFAGVGVGRLKFTNVADPWNVKRKADEIVGE